MLKPSHKHSFLGLSEKLAKKLSITQCLCCSRTYINIGDGPQPVHELKAEEPNSAHGGECKDLILASEKGQLQRRCLLRRTVCELGYKTPLCICTI